MTLERLVKIRQWAFLFIFLCACISMLIRQPWWVLPLSIGIGGAIAIIGNTGIGKRAKKFMAPPVSTDVLIERVRCAKVCEAMAPKDIQTREQAIAAGSLHAASDMIRSGE